MIKKLGRLAKKILYQLVFVFFYFKAHRHVSGEKSIVVFDIDNTLADTWPSFLKDYESDSDRLVSLVPFASMIELIYSYSKLGHHVMFLTARDYRYYFLTNAWLKRYVDCKFSLVMVSRPSEKVKILKSFSGCNIDFYDDLSYSHETGVVQYYSDDIYDVKNISNVRYFDSEYILKVQAGGSDE